MGIWHVIQKLILLLGLFLTGITHGGGSQGGNHKVRCWGRSMLPVESYLLWDGDLHVVIAEAGVGGLARRAPWRMLPMLDYMAQLSLDV